MICVSIVEKEVSKALEALEEASRVADMAEIRLDALEVPEVRPFFSCTKKPLLFTFRAYEEGGLRKVSLKERLSFLKEALSLGAAWIDWEWRMGEKSCRELLAESPAAGRVLLSFHDFSSTPSEEEMKKIVLSMKNYGAHAGKIVTWASTMEDNLKVLSLVSWARNVLSFPLVGFCMGDKGRLSRVACVLLGSPFTYASLSGKQKAAPGQIEASTLKKILSELVLKG